MDGNKIVLSLDDFEITFKLFTKGKKDNTKIRFYLKFFNRFPDLINDNSSDEINELFWKVFPNYDNFAELQKHAKIFSTIMEFLTWHNLPKQYREALKEECILYIHNSARTIFDFIFETTNQDSFLIVDNLINQINDIFDFNDYIIPWYDYTHEKLQSIDFELKKMEVTDSDEKFIEYFKLLSEQPLNLIHRTTDKISLDDDYKLQKILANHFFDSLPEEQNLLNYLLTHIAKENNTSQFEINALIPINNEYAVMLIIDANLENDNIVFGKTNPFFFNIIAKALGAYFSKTSNDSNLFIRAINPNIDIFQFDKNMEKHSHKYNELYGFFFSKDFSYGLTKNETKNLLETGLYTLKYKNPTPGTFYIDAADLFSKYATDKAISLILGNVKFSQKS